MKITLSKLSDAYNSLSKLAQEQLPIKLSYAINKNMRFFESDTSFYKNKMYELYRTYFKTDDNGNFISEEIDSNTASYQIKDGKAQELTQKIRELNDTVADVEIYSIDLELLMSSNITVEANVFNNIDFLIIE